MSLFCFEDLDCLVVKYFIPEQFAIDPAGKFMGMYLKSFGKFDKYWVSLML
jgi:hypothetical protein